MKKQRPISSEDVGRAVSEVKGHPESSSLGLLAHDVLSRQAEGRTLFAGKEFVSQRVVAHSVERDLADTAFGNLVTILERGPVDNLECALVAAFAVGGFAHAVASLSAPEREASVERFVAHADWLDMCSPYRLYGFVHVLLDEQVQEAICQAICRAILAAEADGLASDPQERARTAVRLTALVEASTPAASQALQTLADKAGDPHTRAVVQTAVEQTARPPELRVIGRIGRVPSSSFSAVLRWVSGWALLSWVGRVLARSLDMRREAELELHDGALRVRRRTQLLGRMTSETEERNRLDLLQGAERSVRYPALHLLVGMVSLSVGILFGGIFLFDALVTGDRILLVVGLVVLAGAGLDLVLDTLRPGWSRRVALQIQTRGSRKLRIVDVPLHEADRFLDELSRRFEKRDKR